MDKKITRLEGLETYNASRKHLGAMERAKRGNWLRRTDVERLLATTAGEQAEPADERAAFNAWAENNAIRTDLGAWDAWNARAGIARAVSKAAPAAPEQVQAAPAGYKLVPIKPTPEMSSAAIKAAAEFRYNSTGMQGFTHADSYRAMIAAAPIAAAPAAPEQWISTSERMPEDGETVRILCPNPTPEAWDAKWNAGSQTFESKANGWVRGDEVSHWMPKPAATEQDAKDAARYRWLRDQNIMAQVGSYSPYVVQGQTMRMLEGTEVDAAVDAAMKTATNEGDHDA